MVPELEPRSEPEAEAEAGVRFPLRRWRIKYRRMEEGLCPVRNAASGGAAAFAEVEVEARMWSGAFSVGLVHLARFENVDDVMNYDVVEVRDLGEVEVA